MRTRALQGEVLQQMVALCTAVDLNATVSAHRKRLFSYRQLYVVYAPAPTCFCSVKRRNGHEVLVRSGGFCTTSKARGEGGQVVQNSFVCIPASMDGVVGPALGIELERIRH